VSREYRVEVRVPAEVGRAAVAAVSDALGDLFGESSVEKETKTTDGLYFRARTSLSGGMGEKEFARQVCEAAWTEAARYLPVSVTMTCLEDLPFERYDSDVAEFRNSDIGVKLALRREAAKRRDGSADSWFDLDFVDRRKLSPTLDLVRAQETRFTSSGDETEREMLFVLSYPGCELQEFPFPVARWSDLSAAEVERRLAGQAREM
jgi:hypothetical protein